MLHHPCTIGCGRVLLCHLWSNDFSHSALIALCLGIWSYITLITTLIWDIYPHHQSCPLQQRYQNKVSITCEMRWKVKVCLPQLCVWLRPFQEWFVENVFYLLHKCIQKSETPSEKNSVSPNMEQFITDIPTKFWSDDAAVACNFLVTMWEWNRNQSRL